MKYMNIIFIFALLQCVNGHVVIGNHYSNFVIAYHTMPDFEAYDDMVSYAHCNTRSTANIPFHFYETGIFCNRMTSDGFIYAPAGPVHEKQKIIGHIDVKDNIINSIDNKELCGKLVVKGGVYIGYNECTHINACVIFTNIIVETIILIMNHSHACA
jgi:hypothetical protein